MYFSFAELFVLLISGANLSSLTCAFFFDKQDEADFQLTRFKLSRAMPLSFVFALLSQVIYLVVLVAWQFRCARFYPGAPIYQTVSFGFALSFVGLLAAFAGTGAKRWTSLAVSLTTGILWILVAIVSVSA